MMWRRAAERLTQSWQTVPHFYLKRDVFAEGLVDWRNGLKQRTDTKVTFTDLIVKVVAAALRKNPYVNGQWNGEGVVFNENVNVGLAVAIDEGLLVPVIHDTDKLGVTEIAQRRAEIVTRSQTGKLKPMDLQGGTFTISNLGMYGIDEFNAIVNPPQAAILAIGRINDRVVPINGEPVIRKVLTLSLSCDHRAVDGARGAQFLDTLSSYIQDPMGLVD
jgi:pyruvate dehydrogenase E2 component (dihydrolipoamide acetyltransferase)